MLVWCTRELRWESNQCCECHFRSLGHSDVFADSAISTRINTRILHAHIHTSITMINITPLLQSRSQNGSTSENEHSIKYLFCAYKNRQPRFWVGWSAYACAWARSSYPLLSGIVPVSFSPFRALWHAFAQIDWWLILQLVWEHSQNETVIFKNVLVVMLWL